MALLLNFTVLLTSIVHSFHDEIITTLPAYMLIKLKHDIGVHVALPGLPPSVVDIEPASLTYNTGLGKKITYIQFPATLAYAIRDYKCQGQTFTWVIECFFKPPVTRNTILVEIYECQFLRRHRIMRWGNIDCGDLW